MVSRNLIRGLQCAALASLIVVLPDNASAQEARTWADATGRFKVEATLVEVKDGVAILKRTSGQTVKVPVSRLSEADQAFLQQLDNPFEVVEDATPATGAKTMSSASASSAESNAVGNPKANWAAPPSVDWDRVQLLDSGFGVKPWSYQPRDNRFAYEPHSARLPAKKNFFEGLRRLKVNPAAGSAVAGYTWTFSTPKHSSRISLVDLKTGETFHSDLVTANMCPLDILSDGKTVLMQGTGGDRDGYETADQVQLWRPQGQSVNRTPSWIPFANEKKAFGKTTNANVNEAFALDNNRVLLLADNGHLACFDLATLMPVWHANLSQNHAIACTTDRKDLFVLDEHLLMHVDPQSGAVLGAFELQDKPRMGWTKIRLNPDGDRMLISFVDNLRVVSLVNGETLDEYSTGGGPVAPNGLSFADNDFVLLDNHLLLHLPSKIKLCDYQDAVIESAGGIEFAGVISDKDGHLAPLQLPHPAADQMLQQAVDDPSVFLIYPGVAVSMDVSAVPKQYQDTVRSGLESAIQSAGYKLTATAPIQIQASVSGPKQEAVSYIARGAYIANTYTSTVKITNQGKDVWTRSSTNIPGVLMTKRDQSIQERLDELGKEPNLAHFKSVALPTLMQNPGDKAGGNHQNALMVSKFTQRGLVDSK